MQSQNQPQVQPQNQGNSLQRGFGGIENPNPVFGQYQPASKQAPPGTTYNGPRPTFEGDTPPPNQSYTNPYAVNPATQPYSPFQNYSMFSSPSGGTGNFDYSMFNYY